MSYYDSTAVQMSATNPYAAQALASVPVQQAQAPVFQAPQGPVGDTVSFSGTQQYPQQEEKSGGLSLGKILGGLVLGVGAVSAWKTHKTMNAFKELKLGLKDNVVTKIDDTAKDVSKISDTHEIGWFDTFVKHLDPRSWFSKNDEAVAKVVGDKKLNPLDNSDNLLYLGEDGKTYFRPNKESDRFIEVKAKETEAPKGETKPPAQDSPPAGDGASAGTTGSTTQTPTPVIDPASVVTPAPVAAPKTFEKVNYYGLDYVNVEQLQKRVDVLEALATRTVKEKKELSILKKTIARHTQPTTQVA